MYSMKLSLFFRILVLIPCFLITSADDIFDQNYYITFGANNVVKLNKGKEVQLALDRSTGSGFESKLAYGSGFFHMKMKLPQNSIGVITTFYLTSHTSAHDEIDFEFLGNDRTPYILHTNIFANGVGGREQQFKLWFDPTKAFHSYKILWNQYHIVFYVDKIPIRIYKNQKKLGVGYPSQPMQVEGTIWHSEDWGSGGRKTDWSQSPFKAYYQNLKIVGCSTKDFSIDQCHSPKLWWNRGKHAKLSSNELKEYQNVKQKYLYYDYCADRKRYPAQPLECSSNK